jgi:hypothetical protein
VGSREALGLAAAKLVRNMSRATGTGCSNRMLKLSGASTGRLVGSFSVLVRFVANAGGVEYETHAYADRRIGSWLGLAS